MLQQAVTFGTAEEAAAYLCSMALGRRAVLDTFAVFEVSLTGRLALVRPKQSPIPPGSTTRLESQ